VVGGLCIALVLSAISGLSVAACNAIGLTFGIGAAIVLSTRKN
jgi:hypothetical protein